MPENCLRRINFKLIKIFKNNFKIDGDFKTVIDFLIHSFIMPQNSTASSKKLNINKLITEVLQKKNVNYLNDLAYDILSGSEYEIINEYISELSFSEITTESRIKILSQIIKKSKFNFLK